MLNRRPGVAWPPVRSKADPDRIVGEPGCRWPTCPGSGGIHVCEMLTKDTGQPESGQGKRTDGSRQNATNLSASRGGRGKPPPANHRCALARIPAIMVTARLYGCRDVSAYGEFARHLTRELLETVGAIRIPGCQGEDAPSTRCCRPCLAIRSTRPCAAILTPARTGTCRLRWTKGQCAVLPVRADRHPLTGVMVERCTDPLLHASPRLASMRALAVRHPDNLKPLPRSPGLPRERRGGLTTSHRKTESQIFQAGWPHSSSRRTERLQSAHARVILQAAGARRRGDRPNAGTAQSGVGQVLATPCQKDIRLPADSCRVRATRLAAGVNVIRDTRLSHRDRGVDGITDGI